jgi:hypothetical protein
VTRRAAAVWPPTLARQPGGYDKLFSLGSSPTGRREVGTHLGWSLGGGGAQRVVRDGGHHAPIFGDSSRACSVALWLYQDNR